MEYENEYQIISKHHNKFWYYTVRIRNKRTGKVQIHKLHKKGALKFASESPILL